MGNNIFFQPLNFSQENLGCLAVNPLRCEDSRFDTFLELQNVTYFKFNASEFNNVNVEECKAECLRNCSCKAVIFRYTSDDISIGGCFLPHEIYSFIHTSSAKIGLNYNSITFIKVQIPKSEGEEKKSSSKLPLGLLVPSVLTGIVFFVFLCTCCFLIIRRPFKKIKQLLTDQASSAFASSLVRKFGYDVLKEATQDFVVKLGEGEYGSVFQGTLADGTTQVAVKQLNNQRTSEFEAEVKTIGRVHHINLVKLIGYCDEVSKKLLVYEFVSNGSLEKWVFNKERAQNMGWEMRREIIIGIAKGLEYLHVHCSPPIIHFDIKPQNILLDGDFTAKIADFGLAKWTSIDQMGTSIRPIGTPGYMAPELLRSINVSLLVDVYSFGVVVLEIICGRRHSDKFNEGFLIELVKRKAIDGTLYDLIDDCNEDMINHRDEVVSTMELAIYCLQPYLERPSMFTIVKVLEGFLNMNPLDDYSFLGTFHVQQELSEERRSTVPMDSILSGAR